MRWTRHQSWAVGIIVLACVVVTWVVRANRAYARIANAGSFDTLLVGAPPTVSAHSLDFQVLLRDPRGAIWFRSLANGATPAGQIYGLCGLYFRDRAVFQRVRRSYEKRRDPVRLLVGCIESEQAFGSVASSSSLPFELMCERLKISPWRWAQVSIGTMDGYALDRLTGR
jgi:hypothetical protein